MLDGVVSGAEMNSSDLIIYYVYHPILCCIVIFSVLDGVVPHAKMNQPRLHLSFHCLYISGFNLSSITDYYCAYQMESPHIPR